MNLNTPQAQPGKLTYQDFDIEPWDREPEVTDNDEMARILRACTPARAELPATDDYPARTRDLAWLWGTVAVGWVAWALAAWWAFA